MKYENFNDFISSLDNDNSEINLRWEEISKNAHNANNGQTIDNENALREKFELIFKDIKD